MNEEKFLKIEAEIENRTGFGCGYWHVCDDHACACALSSKGFDPEIYASMRKKQIEEIYD